MPKKYTTVEADEWDVYAKIDFLVAITLVIVALVAAEPPVFQRQVEPAGPPYEPRGWRPNGLPFDPTRGFQNQEQYPVEGPEPFGPPNDAYGPPLGEQPTTPRFQKREQVSDQPSSSIGSPSSIPFGTRQSDQSSRPNVSKREEESSPSVGSSSSDINTRSTTTEDSKTPLEHQAENLESGSRNEKLRSDKPQKESEVQPGNVYVVLPQGQNLIYAAPLKIANAEALTDGRNPKDETETVKEPSLAPVQAVPALAKIQAPIVLANYDQISQLIQLQKVQAVPVARYVSPLPQSSVVNPYGSSLVQIYQ